MSPSLVVVRCTFSPAGVAGRREAGAERRPTGVPQPQPLRPSARLDSAPILPPNAHPKPTPQMIRRRRQRHALDLHRRVFDSQGPPGQFPPLSVSRPDTPTAPAHPAASARSPCAAPDSTPHVAGPLDTTARHKPPSSRLAPPAPLPSSTLHPGGAAPPDARRRNWQLPR
jgi:hypothetical protein